MINKSRKSYLFITTMEEKNDNVELVQEIKVQEAPVKSKKNIFIEDIIRISTGVFGEDRVDSVKRTSYLDIIIHFPEILLKSSTTNHKKEHLIKDVFLKFIFNTNIQKFINTSFLRSTFTYAEIKASYAHSHVSGGINEWVTAICQGNTELAKTKNLLLAQHDNQIYEDFLYLYNNWISWESIEGGPYRKIENIKDIYCTDDDLTEIDSTDLLINLTNFFKVFDLKLNICTKSDIVNLELNDEYVKSIIDKTCKIKVHYDKKSNKYLTPGVDLVKINKEIESYKKNLNYPFMFKNKDYNIKIEELDYIIDESSLVPHPDISTHIINTLKQIINAKYKNNERISFIQ